MKFPYSEAQLLKARVLLICIVIGSVHTDENKSTIRFSTRITSTVISTIRSEGTRTTSTGINNGAIHVPQTTLHTIDTTQPTPTPVNINGRCQVYQGGSVCQRYRQNNQKIYWRSDHQYNQTKWGWMLERALDTIRNSPMFELSPQCQSLMQQIACYWLFPICTTTNTSDTSSPLCSESCQLLQANPCWKQVAGNQTVDKLLSALIPSTSFDIKKVSTIPCQYKLQSDSHQCENISPESDKVNAISTIANPMFNQSTVRTCGGSVPNNTPCVFPFEYNGIQYHECTQVGSFRTWKHWCATESGNYDLHHKWGFCDCSDVQLGQLNATCQSYNGGHVCNLVRHSAMVFVDNRFSQEFLGSKTMQPLNFTLSNNRDGDKERCLTPMIDAICHLVFPDCIDTYAGYSVYPMPMCQESCNQFQFGYCSHYWTKSMRTVIAHFTSINPVHVFANIPQCKDLPSVEDNPQICMNIGIYLGYNRSKPTDAELFDEQTSQLAARTAGLVAAVAFLIASFGILAVWFFRRRKNCFKRTSSLSDQLSTSNSNSVVSMSPRSLLRRSQRASVISIRDIANAWTEENQHKSDGLSDTEIAKGILEYPLEEIEYVKDLGEGAFGKVFMGIINNLTDNGAQVPVAVKLLKSGASDKIKEDFHNELYTMSQLCHPNIIELFAKCFSSQHYCMMFEYMCYGDLNKFLRLSTIGQARCIVADTSTMAQESKLPNDDNTVTINDLVYITMQVCCGLSYLEDKRFVHRDIATRNCLVGKGLVTKIADFGLSRDIYTAEYYKVGGAARLPIRWLAPESLMYGKFNFKTDIWSFGVFMWEVFTLGKQPYYGRSNEEVICHVTCGGRMPPPDDFCPPPIIKIMGLCCDGNPETRPNATELLNILQKDSLISL